MLESYNFNEETNKIELTVLDNETGEEVVICVNGRKKIKPQKYYGAKYKNPRNNLE